jgi:spore coat protein U-like protein
MSARLHAGRWLAWLLLACAPAGLQAAVTCTVSATGPAFGIYNPLTTTPTLADGQVSASCTLTGTTTTTVSLVSSYSAGSSGTYAARTMLSGVNTLSYNLYYDAAFSQVRGDGTGGSQTGGASFTLTRTAPTQSVTSVIYGRIPALQDVAAGSYLDTIVFTVTY